MLSELYELERTLMFLDGFHIKLEWVPDSETYNEVKRMLGKSRKMLKEYLFDR